MRCSGSARPPSRTWQPGSTIINTASVQGFDPSPHLLDYATTKAGIVNFTKGLARPAGREGHPGQRRRPGPGVDPADPRHDGRGEGGEFGGQSPLGRAAQPAELAPTYVFLASQESSYITAEVIAVTGGSPIV